MDKDFYSNDNNEDWLNNPSPSNSPEPVVPKDPALTEEDVRRVLDREFERRVQPQAAPVAPEVEKDTFDEDMDNVLTRIIGSDTPERKQGVQDMKQLFLKAEERARKAALREIESVRNAELEEERRTSQKIDTHFSEISRKYGVDLAREDNKNERAAFLDFVKKISPKDEDGQIVSLPNLTEVFDVYRSSNGGNRAREAASRSIQSSQRPVKPENKTYSWNELDNILGL